MEGATDARYWCHMCSQMVNPITEVELKCPLCQSGFVEEMDTEPSSRRPDESSALASDRALALWAPILLGMMGNPHNRRRLRGHLLDEGNNTDDDTENGERPREGETELDRELDAMFRRRRRGSSAAILQLLQGLSAGISAEPENSANERNREQDRLVLINPFNQTILLHGSDESNQDQNMAPSPNPFGSLGDYFVGPGLDLLLQHLAENDPNRYGTLPAQKEVVEAMPTVKIDENMQCPICLDDFELGTDAKEMPCKHRFHTSCIFPWLELHSSCPVCRYQLPADESKRDSGGTNNDNHHSSDVDVPGGGGGDLDMPGGSESRFALPWPLNSLTSRSHGNSSQSSPSASSSGGPGASSQTEGS